jgi:hypothetical protein
MVAAVSERHGVCVAGSHVAGGSARNSLFCSYTTQCRWEYTAEAEPEPADTGASAVERVMSGKEACPSDSFGWAFCLVRLRLRFSLRQSVNAEVAEEKRAEDAEENRQNVAFLPGLKPRLFWRFQGPEGPCSLRGKLAPSALAAVDAGLSAAHRDEAAMLRSR